MSPLRLTGNQSRLLPVSPPMLAEIDSSTPATLDGAAVQKLDGWYFLYDSAVRMTAVFVGSYSLTLGHLVLISLMDCFYAKLLQICFCTQSYFLNESRCQCDHGLGMVWKTLVLFKDMCLEKTCQTQGPPYNYIKPSKKSNLSIMTGPPDNRTHTAETKSPMRDSSKVGSHLHSNYSSNF